MGSLVLFFRADGPFDHSQGQRRRNPDDGMGFRVPCLRTRKHVSGCQACGHAYEYVSMAPSSEKQLTRNRSSRPERIRTGTQITSKDQSKSTDHQNSFPCSAWECRLGRSCVLFTQELRPGSERPINPGKAPEARGCRLVHKTTQSNADGIPTEDRGNESHDRGLALPRTREIGERIPAHSLPACSVMQTIPAQSPRKIANPGIQLDRSPSPTQRDPFRSPVWEPSLARRRSNRPRRECRRRAKSVHAARG